MRTMLVLACTTVLLGAGCASPDGEVLAAADGAAPIVKECRFAKTTGTKMRYRICYTAAQWAAIDAADAQEENTDPFFRRALENSTLGGDSNNSP